MSTKKETNVLNLLTPREIVEELDKYVIGQEQAKRTLALAVYNHYKKLYNNLVSDTKEVEFDKSNAIILGATGSGKCVCSDTKIRLKNKTNNTVSTLTINDLIEKIQNNLPV